MYSVSEIIENYGPIMAADSELGLLVSVNGSYLNLWIARRGGQYENTTCRALDSANGLYSLSAAEVIDRAEAYLKDIINGNAE